MSGIGEDVHTGSFTFQTFQGIERLIFDDIASLGRGNGSGHIRFAHGTITHHHQFVQCLGILQQYDIESAGTCGIDLLVDIADVGDGDDSPFIDLQPEVPIYIGHGSVGRTVFNDVGSDNGESLFIEDSTGNFTFLLLRNGHFPYHSFFTFDLCFPVYKNILPRYFIGEGGVFGELIEYFVDGLVFKFHIIKYGTIDIAAFIKENKF